MTYNVLSGTLSLYTTTTIGNDLSSRWVLVHAEPA